MIKFSKKIDIKKVIQGHTVVLGAILYALGINQLQVLNYGLGSFDSLTLQITKLTSINQFGNASFTIHLIFFVVLLLFINRYKIDFKMIVLSVISIFILTRLVNFFSQLAYYPHKSVQVFVITFLVLNLGLFLLAKSNIIIAPFDKFLAETAKYKKKFWNYKVYSGCYFASFCFSNKYIIRQYCTNYSIYINTNFFNRY